MELRGMLIFFGSVLAVVLGQQQCRDPRKCMPLDECPEYQPYVGQPSKFWPSHVQNEVKGLFCGMDKKLNEKIYKFCCKPRPVVNPNPWYSKPAGGKSGRDLLDLKQCGKSSKQRIAHGRIAEVFEFPWMALLGDINGNFHCGGSLIAESFVLTAAHCGRNNVFVRLGETDLSKEIDCNIVEGQEDCAEPYQDIQVDKFISHELYSVSKKNNDIALVKLAKPAKLNYNVRPICLPLPEMCPKTYPIKMIVSGWGVTEYRNSISNVLRYATVPIVKPDQCRQSLEVLSDAATVDESQVCAGGAEDYADNCQGDSGGPLQYYGNKAIVIHGVVAWGQRFCGKDKTPGVYTKVSHYLDWIIDKLK